MTPTIEALYFIGYFLAATVLPWNIYTRLLTDITRARIWLSISARCQANGEAAMHRRLKTVEFLAQSRKKLSDLTPSPTKESMPNGHE